MSQRTKHSLVSITVSGKQWASSVSANDANHEYDDFLEDLEEDADLRQNVNVYKVAKLC